MTIYQLLIAVEHVLPNWLYMEESNLHKFLSPKSEKGLP
jgi:hypothetical protein